jgi:hypothetical protein
MNEMDAGVRMFDGLFQMSYKGRLPSGTVLLVTLYRRRIMLVLFVSIL